MLDAVKVIAAYLKTKQSDIFVLGVEPFCKEFVSDIDKVYKSNVESFLDEYSDDLFDLYCA